MVINTLPSEREPGFDTWDSTDDAPRGGGGIWVTPSLDAEKGLLYIAVGNPVPDFFGGVRMGNNLYTAAMIVLDARNLAASTSECSSAIVDESPAYCLVPRRGAVQRVTISRASSSCPIWA